MKSKDIKISLELLHRRILNNSKFAEEITEAEIMALVEAIKKEESEYEYITCPCCGKKIKVKR